MKVALTFVALLLTSSATPPPLEWPELRTQGTLTESIQRNIEERILSAQEIEEAGLRAELLAVAELEYHRVLFESSSIYSYKSRVGRVARINESNAVVTFETNHTSLGPTDDVGLYTFVYALARINERWNIVKTYRLLRWRIIE